MPAMVSFTRALRLRPFRPNMRQSTRSSMVDTDVPSCTWLDCKGGARRSCGRASLARVCYRYHDGQRGDRRTQILQGLGCIVSLWRCSIRPIAAQRMDQRIQPFKDPIQCITQNCICIHIDPHALPIYTCIYVCVMFVCMHNIYIYLHWNRRMGCKNQPPWGRGVRGEDQKTWGKE